MYAKAKLQSVPFKWKGQSAWPNKQREKSYAEVGKICDKNKFVSLEIVKKKNCASFAIAPLKLQVTAIVLDKCLV